MIKNVKKNFLSACVALALINFGNANASVLGDSVNMAFDSMTNVTEPQAFETVNSRGIYGGRLVTKNKIFNESLVSIQLPGFKAGCGGIDLFAGSFSFIDSEKLNQLLRAIGQNAVGYAFQMGLKAAMPSVHSLLTNLQKIVQELNQFNANSCQLAQGIVNDVSAATFGNNFRNQYGTSATLTGAVRDFMSSRDSSDTPTKLKETNSTKFNELHGNVVFNALTKNNVTSWVSFTASGFELQEMLMSVTGTIIATPKNDTQDTTNVKNTDNSDGTQTSDSLPQIKHVAHTLSIKDLMNPSAEGTQILKCEADNGNDLKCMEPTPSASTGWKGFTQKLLLVLNGDPTPVSTVNPDGSTTTSAGSKGLLDKMADIGNGAFTNEEKALMMSLPESSGSLLKALNAHSRKASKEFAQALSHTLALDMAYGMIVEALRVTQTALNGYDQNGGTVAIEAKKLLAKREQEITAEYISLQQAYGTKKDILQHFEKTLVTLKALTFTEENQATIPVTGGK